MLTDNLRHRKRQVARDESMEMTSWPLCPQSNVNLDI